MGSSFGSTIIFNNLSRPISEIEAVFRNILRQNGEIFQARIKAFGMPSLPGMDSMDGGAILYKPDSPWVSTLEDYTISGFDLEHIGPHVQRYADSFGLSAITISAFDSDVLLLAFCNPGEQPSVFAATHSGAEEDPYLFEEHGITEEHLAFPEPLKSFATPEQLNALHEIWQGDEVFMEDIAYKISEVLGFEIVRDQQEEVEGYIYIRI